MPYLLEKCFLRSLQLALALFCSPQETVGIFPALDHYRPRCGLGLQGLLDLLDLGGQLKKLISTAAFVLVCHIVVLLVTLVERFIV